jgi:hypothetical protein
MVDCLEIAQNDPAHSTAAATDSSWFAEQQRESCCKLNFKSFNSHKKLKMELHI